MKEYIEYDHKKKLAQFTNNMEFVKKQALVRNREKLYEEFYYNTFHGLFANKSECQDFADKLSPALGMTQAVHDIIDFTFHLRPSQNHFPP